MCSILEMPQQTFKNKINIKTVIFRWIKDMRMIQINNQFLNITISLRRKITKMMTSKTG